MYCLRVNVTSPRQIPMHILMSLANKLPCILVSTLLASKDETEIKTFAKYIMAAMSVRKKKIEQN